MAHIKTISAKDVTPEEITQVREFVTELPKDNPLRKFILEMLAGLDLGFDMTLIFEHPAK